MVYDEVDEYLDSVAAFLEAPLWRITEAVSRRFGSAGLKLIRILLKLFLCVVLFGFLLWFAFLTYALVYYLVIPIQHLEKPVFFDFASQSGNPESTVHLLGHQWSYSRLSARLDSQVSSLLTSDESYDINLEFVMPDYTIDALRGMVVVRANALTRDGESNRVLASSTMPLDVFPSPSVVRQSRRIALLLPLVLGFLTEEATVSTRLFDGYVENGDFPTSAMNLTLVSSQRDPLSLHSARLLFHVQLSGIRWFIYHWFLTSSVFSIAFITVFEAVAFIIMFWLYWDQFVVFLRRASGATEEPVAAQMQGEAPEDSESSDEGLSDVYESSESGEVDEPVQADDATEPSNLTDFSNISNVSDSESGLRRRAPLQSSSSNNNS